MRKLRRAFWVFTNRLLAGVQRNACKMLCLPSHAFLKRMPPFFIVSTTTSVAPRVSHRQCSPCGCSEDERVHASVCPDHQTLHMTIRPVFRVRAAAAGRIPLHESPRCLEPQEAHLSMTPAHVRLWGCLLLWAATARCAGRFQWWKARWAAATPHQFAQPPASKNFMGQGAC